MAENIDIDTKITFLGQLGEKLCCKTAKIRIFDSFANKKIEKKFFGQNKKSVFFYTPCR